MSSLSRPSWLTEGVVLAAVPVAAYVLAYLGAAGASLTFSIPWSFVAPSTSDIAQWLLLVLVVVMFPTLLLLSSVIASLGFLELDEVRDIFSNRYIRRLTAWSLFALAVRIFVIPPRHIYWIVVLLPLLVLHRDLSDLVSGIIRCVQWRQINSFTLKAVRPDVLRSPKFDVFTVVICFTFLSVFSFMWGYYDTAHKEWYWVPEHSCDAVILSYRDQLVTVEFEPGTGVVKKNFKIMKAEGERLQRKKIGPLKPQADR